MQIKNNIIITGFMATGKSTTGPVIAQKMKREYFDTDILIEKKQGLSISDIFEKYGKEHFRNMERDIVIELAEKKNCVIATGGGLLLDSINTEILSKNGKIYCLSATVTEIIKRLHNDSTNSRPLLEKTDDLSKTTIALFEERASAYNRFLQVTVDNCTPANVANKIINLHCGVIEKDSSSL